MTKMPEDQLDERLRALGSRWQSSADSLQERSEVDWVNVAKKRASRPTSLKVVLLAASVAALLIGGFSIAGSLAGGGRSVNSSPGPSGVVTLSSNLSIAPTSYPHSDQRWLLYQCGERVELTNDGITDQGVKVAMKRKGDEYAVSVKVTEPELAKPMQVIASLIITDSQGFVVGMPSNETMALTPPTKFSMSESTDLGVIGIPHKLTANQSLFSSCTGDSRTPVLPGTYRVAAMVRLDADIFGASPPQEFVYPED